MQTKQSTLPDISSTNMLSKTKSANDSSSCNVILKVSQCTVISLTYILPFVATLEPQAEDFSWDEEDESPTSAEGPSSPAKDEALQNPTRNEPESHDSASAIETLSSPPLPSAGITDSSNTSGRVSEESYVAVKNHKSQHGIELPDKVGIQAAPAAATSKADDDDEDSDWE